LAKGDDEDKPLKTNAAPTLKPPGLGLGGVAPAGSVGTERAGMTGPVYIVWGDERDYPADGVKKPQPRDTTTPRFNETDDPDINRMYGRDHIMVRKDGSEMRPDEWPKDKSEGQDEGRSLSEDESREQQEAVQEQSAPEHEPDRDDSKRPQLWEDENRRDDDGIDR
jgi:hypothetical protein